MPKIKKCRKCGKEFTQYKTTDKCPSKECKKERKIKKRNSLPWLRKTCMELWSQYVKNRDKCCQYCGRTDYLNAHHIYSRSNQWLRFEEDNGITLCAGHHTMSSSFAAHKTPLEFIEWLEQKIWSKKYNELRSKARKVTKIDEEYLRNKINFFQNGLNN